MKQKDYRLFITARIATLIEDREMSKEDLARQAGVAKRTITSYIAGHRIPQLHTMFRIAKALKVPVSFLIYGVVEDCVLDDDYVKRIQRTSYEQYLALKEWWEDR